MGLDEVVARTDLEGLTVSCVASGSTELASFFGYIPKSTRELKSLIC